MAKKTIYMTEAQKKKIFEQEQFMLSEDKNTDYLKKLIKTYSSEMIKPYLETKVSELPNEYKNHFQQADNRLFDSCVQNNANLLMFLRLQFLKYFDISHGKGPIEFIPGIGRIGIAELGFFNEYANQSDISLLKQLVLFIHTNKELFDIDINSDLNGWNFTQLKEHINQKRKDFNLKSRERLSNSYNQGQSRYTVVPINSQEEARKYAPYTTWCVTDNAYSSYAQGGARFYFCLRDGFENVKKEVGEDCPLDEYGLSMVSILVDMEGEPTYVTTRWNHQYDGENNENFRTAEQVQNILGINFYQTFKPYTREELHEMGIVLFDEVQELLDSGKEPEEIFDWVHNLENGLVQVKLNEKYNYINTKGKLLSDKWFDYIDFFHDGCARVKLNGKWNLINTEGKFVSNTWFDDANYFQDGFAGMKLNKKWNFISTEGKLLSDTWFKSVGLFFDGFAWVFLNRKYNFIDTKGKFLSDTWFDDANNFCEKFAVVGLNGKYNFIDTEGKLFNGTWFDWAGDFRDGVALVKLNRSFNYINTEGKFISNTWFDTAYVFHKGLAKVELNNKWNFINTEGKIISDTWFDDVWDFCEGFANVKLNRKYNFINTEGKIISGTWFDDALDFCEGFVRVKLNGKWYKLDRKGNLYDSSTEELVKKATIQESHKTIYITETQLSEIKKKHKKKMKDCSAMAQVHNKVNSGIMAGITCGGVYEEMENLNEGIYDIEDLTNDESLYDCTSILEEFLDDKKRGIKVKQWNLIPAEQYQNLLRRYMASPEMARIPYEVVLRWFKDIIVPNAFAINNITMLAGHSSYFPFDEIYGVFNIEDGDYEYHTASKILEDAGFYDWCKLPDGSDGWSDYGLEPLMKTVMEYRANMSAEDILILINRCLDVAHQRGDLASAFIEGGKSTCSKISNSLNENPNKVAVPFGDGLYWDDGNAVAFLCVIGNKKIFVAKERGIGHTDMFQELYTSGQLPEDILDNGFDDIFEFYDLQRSGRYWPSENIISLYKTPMDKAGANDLYDCVDELRRNGIAVDTKSLIVEYWDNPSTNSLFLPYSWFFNGTLEMLLATGLKTSTPLDKNKNIFVVRLSNGVFNLDRQGNVAEPATAQVALTESISSREYDFKKDLKSILQFMKKEGLNVYPYPKVKLNWEDQDGLFIKTGYYEPDTKTVVLFCKDRHPKDILRSAAHEFVHHSQNLDGQDLTFTAEDDVKGNGRLEEVESDAYLKGNICFRKWTEYQHDKEMLQEEKKVVNDEGKTVPEKCNKCGGDVVLQIHGEPVYICKDCGKYFGTMPFSKNLNENLIDEISPEEVDLSSFNIKKHLNPKFWKDGKLDSRIRLKLLDISDDFIDFLEVDWAKPKDVIITGSLANYNWSKKYSDIDLHVLYDFKDIDKKTEFVKEYFDAKKKLWNEEHPELTVFGFPIEVYVQDVNEEHASTGVYSLDKNDWITEPKRKPLATAKVNKEYIKKKVAYYANLIDKIVEDFDANPEDEYIARNTNEKAEALFKKIRGERTDALGKGKGEISNGNVIFKALRRFGYIEKIIDVRQRSYDALNSINEGKTDKK